MRHVGFKRDLPEGTNHSFHRLTVYCRLAVLILGGLHAWAAARSHSMNADGISYLDLGDALLNGDWSSAISPVWSPLYSAILGYVMWQFDPPMRWEFPAVHLTNFAIYLGALFCFEFYWRQLNRYRLTLQDGNSSDSQTAFPEWAWIILGYLLFVTAALTLIEIWAVTPDLLMAGFVFLAAGLVVRMRLGFYTWRTSLLLGFVLGLSFLTKSVMFVLGFVFLAIALLSVTKLHRGFTHVIGASGVFIFVIAPFIVLLSTTQGKFTFGSVSTLTYIRHVNNIPYPHWQGESEEYGVPAHPSRQIFDQPPIYEFGTPIDGTYPIAFNPAYWYEGADTRFDFTKQLKRLSTSLLYYIDVFFVQQAGLTFGVLILYLLGTWHWPGMLVLMQRWGLAMLALIALGMYAPLLAEGRYIGVFSVLLWGDLLANARLPVSDTFKKFRSRLSILMIAFLLLNLGLFNIRGAIDLTQSPASQSAQTQPGPPRWPGEVAQALHQFGVQPGDHVAVIGYAFDSYWARLARVKIVAEMLGSEAAPFWVGDRSFQHRIIHAFASTGAQAIVAESVPAYASLDGWHRIENSNYFIYLLAE